MLSSLQIENYALIEHLEFNPVKGLTVITGETGAGKSIIMGALSLILGQRADAKSVRTGATKCVIEATFNIGAYGLKDFFADNDLEYDENNTIIRREIYATGKSRAFINDSPVQLTTLKSIGDFLIDIHSQHQNLLLGKDTFQQEIICAVESVNYPLVLLINKLNGVQFADMPETAERHSVIYIIINSDEDMAKYRNYMAVTAKPEDSFFTADQVVAMTAVANPDATYAGLVETLNHMTLDDLK